MVKPFTLLEEVEASVEVASMTETRLEDVVVEVDEVNWDVGAGSPVEELLVEKMAIVVATETRELS